MTIRFIRDAPAMSATGWSRYRKDIEADFPSGSEQWLIDNGYARDVNAVPEPEPEEIPGQVEERAAYDEWTVAALRDLASELEITGYSALRKAELIEAIEQAQQ